MVFEHFALNVANVEAVSTWYCTHLGLSITSQQKDKPYMTFLADGSGRVIMEFYSRNDAPMQEFAQVHPLTFHVAFVSEDAETDKKRLQTAGAHFVEDIHKEDGSHLVMLRDPWGMPLQLCQRAKKF